MTVARLSWAIALVGLVAAWPHDAAGQTAGPAPSAATTTAGEAVAPASPWSWIKLPKVSMPKIEMPKMPADPMAPFKASARKVGDGTKKAWEGTKEFFTFGGKDEPVARTASAAEPPSMWQRMFGGAEEEQPPQTMADWMRQPRPEDE